MQCMGVPVYSKLEYPKETDVYSVWVNQASINMELESFFKEKELNISFDDFDRGDIILIDDALIKNRRFLRLAKEKAVQIIFAPQGTRNIVQKEYLSVVDLFILNELQARMLIGEFVHNAEQQLILLNSQYPHSSFLLMTANDGDYYADCKLNIKQGIFRRASGLDNNEDDIFMSSFVGYSMQGMDVTGALEYAGMLTGYSTFEDRENRLPDWQGVRHFCNRWREQRQENTFRMNL